jgi:muramidase (phage lysozyme)
MGVYKNAGAKGSMGYQNSIHHCAKYVKVALWAAGYSTTEDGDIDSKAGLARELGPALLRNGFTDVTSQLPDARWAAPGDIIVYEKKGSPNAAGHIDIRTYDGYISDFIADYLPVRKFNVIGIYRKYYDPMPEKRIRAFLKVIRECECHGIDDEKRYFRLQNSLNDSMYFSDTSKHPYANQPNTRGSFSGAYQIKYSTWNDQVTKYDLPANFIPETQDMMAVSLLEYRKALGYIRKGEISAAITNTTITSEWSSLPNGQHGRQERRGNDRYFYSVDDVIQRFNEFLKEL